jgi:hypothetical protein
MLILISIASALSVVFNCKRLIQRAKNDLKIFTGLHSRLRTQFPGDLNPAGGLCATRFSSAAVPKGLCRRYCASVRTKHGDQQKRRRRKARNGRRQRKHTQASRHIKSEWRERDESRGRRGCAESECSGRGQRSQVKSIVRRLPFHLARAGCDIVALAVCTHLWRAKVTPASLGAY